jgi:CheY-like chemotaxis protein
LLVEDNPVNAKITKSILEKQRWNVDIAVHGKQALDMVLANYDKYNAILMVNIIFCSFSSQTTTLLLNLSFAHLSSLRIFTCL